MDDKQSDELSRQLSSASIGIRLQPGQSKEGITLEFFRSVNVPLDWRRVLGRDPRFTAYTAPEDSFAHARRAFERSWGFSSSPTSAEIRGLPQGPRLFTLDQQNVVSKVFIAYGLGPEFYPKLKGHAVLPAGSGPVYLTRFFAVVPKGGRTVSLDAFATDAGYEAFWSDFECFRSADSLETEAFASREIKSYVEFLDLSSDLILSRYKQLDASRRLADKLSVAAGRLLDAPATSGLTVDEVARMFGEYLAMTDPKEEIDKRLADLQSVAKDRGYILSITDGTVVDPGDNSQKIPLPAGKLLLRSRQTAQIEIGFRRVSVKLIEKPVFLDSGIPDPVVSPSSAVSYGFDTPNEVIASDESMISATEKRLRDIKPTGFTSYIFSFDNRDYVTARGERLADILTRCDKDDKFCRTCAIWIPVYSQSLGRQRRRSGFVIVRCPLPGYAPTRMPQLLVDEEAALELSWTGTKLGELAATVALAPGEERTVTLEQTLAREREDITSESRTLESDNTFSSEFSDEVEREARNTVNLSTSSNWSASVGGSGNFFDIFSVSESASGGQSWTKSSEEFYRSLSKVGRKSASTLSQKARREISTSSTTRVEERRVERTEMALRNINDGRTLSVLFYRIANVYKQVPVVRDLRLIALPAVPVVEGLKLRWPQMFGRTELDHAIDALTLPGQLFSATIAGRFESLARYWDEWIGSLASLLSREYVKPDEGEPTPSNVLIASPAEVDRQSREPPSHDPATVASRLAAVIVTLSTVQEPTTGSHAHVFSDELEIGTSSLYADCVVGALQGTEPYSEEMRTQEVRSRDAQVALTLSGALLQASQARRAGMQDLNEVKTVIRSADLLHLTLTVRNALTAGTWNLYVDGKLVGNTQVAGGAHAVTQVDLSFNSPQLWMSAEESNLGMLVHSRTAESIIFVV